MDYNAYNVYRRELAPGTVSLTGDRAQGDDSKHWAYSIPCSLYQTRTKNSSVYKGLISPGSITSLSDKSKMVFNAFYEHDYHAGLVKFNSPHFTYK